ncbi:Predicted naringenin-chalcone synthase [Psychroflexus salarius]|uniref:Predicted naringenin-chalcone synthase n=1 Tax=Psychroflexus salarius TaxID=1155689 RepID=A0A1M4SAT3_9FLAO|nr:type III polyketide synthase [Psychroflexus salarius]SHE29278.1 Predicted naringenin-chalcone synthase [Psychroflexus salarius]
MVKITQVSTQLPKYTSSTAEVIPYIEDWLEHQDERFKRKVIKIFEGAAVDRRYAIMPPNQVFTSTSFEEKNKIYQTEAKQLGHQVLEKALLKSNWDPKSLDYIITVSCTGIMIPSLDAYLINSLGLKQDIVRLPVTEMGCVAGVSGIIYAKQFLENQPNKRAAVIAVEAPTATLQHSDFSMANMVSAAIFGDGAACVLMSSEEQASGAQICDEQMYHFYDQTHMMGFDLTNNGLKMILDIAVPDTIATHFPEIIHPFLKRNNLSIETIEHLIFHPGGKKIILTVEDLFKDLGKNINATKSVLKNYGNMSSATVLFVLAQIMQDSPKKDDYGLMLSFGPGFTAQRLLLKF